MTVWEIGDDVDAGSVGSAVVNGGEVRVVGVALGVGVAVAVGAKVGELVGDAVGVAVARLVDVEVGVGVTAETAVFVPPAGTVAVARPVGVADVETGVAAEVGAALGAIVAAGV